MFTFGVEWVEGHIRDNQETDNVKNNIKCMWIELQGFVYPTSILQNIYFFNSAVMHCIF
jgi:hypothetical protein